MGISSTLSSKVTHLLCEQVGSSKYVKAKAKGIPIKDEAWVHREISGAGKKLTKKKRWKEKKTRSKRGKREKRRFYFIDRITAKSPLSGKRDTCDRGKEASCGQTTKNN